MNLATLLEMATTGMGDRVAVRSPGGYGLTYRALQLAAAGAAERFDASGADHVVLLARNGPGVPIAMFGAAWAGLTYVPLNYLLPRKSVAQLIERLEPAVVVCDADAREKLSPALNRRSIDIEELLRLDATPGAPTPVARDAEAVRLFTSGTTSEPKAAILRHRHLTSYVLSTVEFASAEPEESMLLSVPPFHIAGVSSVLTSVYRGRRIVPLPRFDPASWLEIVGGERITHALLVPTMLARILEEVTPGDTRLESLQLLSYGGAPMPRVVIEEALRVFPKTTGFVNAYGLTETSSTIAILGPQDHRAAIESDDPKVRERLRSVGQPVPAIRLEIRDESGSVLPPGQVGEIVVAGEQVAGEYVEGASKRDKAGWLRTGDRGWLDDDNFLFIEGRDDNLIISGGENLSPSEIENSLLRHPAVMQAAVVGIPDETWGERVAAMIVPRSGEEVRGDELSTWVRDELGSLKAPDLIVICEDVPRTPVGKIVHRQVRDEILRRVRGPK